MENNAAIAPRKFATFAILDLETCNLPAHNFNRTAMTEICIYAFAASVMNESSKSNNTNDEATPVTVPVKPRVLHKLTLLLNPAMMVDPESERITGLNNYMLEEESTFNANAADTMLGFLQHLQQPVCLVAHNGWGFDFPIVKKSFEKLQKDLPSSMVCVDSLRAFLEIDRKRKAVETDLKESTKALTDTPIKATSEAETTLQDALSENSLFNWRQINESTPKRAPPISATSANIKRKLLADANNFLTAEQNSPEQEVTPAKRPIKDNQPTITTHFKSRRSLHFGEDASPVIKKYPPRGVYKLADMYKRIFKQTPVHAHHAEADVDMLMKLLLHYGEDFVAYAEQHAKPFFEVPRLGRY